MFKNINFILGLLNKKQKLSIFFLQLLILFSAVAETVGIFSLAPFITLIAEPAIIQSYNIPFLGNYFLNIEPISFISKFGFALIIFFFFITILNILTNWLIIKFSEKLSVHFTTSLYKHYLNKDFAFFLNNNSGDLVSKIILESYRVTGGMFKGLMNFNAKFSLTCLLLITLLIFNFKVTILCLFVISSMYGMLVLKVNKSLNVAGKNISIENKERVKTISESFDNIKEIIINKKLNYFDSKFYYFANKLANNQILISSLSALPLFILQFLLISSLILAMLYFSFYQNVNFQDIIAVLSVYALAGLRLMPSIHGMFNSLVIVKSTMPALLNIKKDLSDSSAYIKKDNYKLDDDEPLDITKNIIIQNLNFKYPHSSKFIFKNANLDILIAKKTGIYGPTGNGKSTLLNILCGLLRPEKIKLLFDEKKVNSSNLKKIKIGYISQSIVLLDTNVYENVAFGLEKKDINMKKVKECLKLASALDFVNKLPFKSNTIVGDKGVKLSGGQIQRLGFARALYNNPKILILDEATNALDSKTERQILNNIDDLINKLGLTVIFVSHDKSILKQCDIIYKVSGMKIINQII